MQCMIQFLNEYNQELTMVRGEFFQLRNQWLRN